MLTANLFLSCLVLAPFAAAHLPSPFSHQPRAHIPFVDEPDESVSVFHQSSQSLISSYKETYYFDQLIDHNNPSKGTFKQRYWHSYEFYEPGGTIVLGTPGEVNAEGFTGYLTNRTINGQIAQATNGATIIIEHRFFGKSQPTGDLSVKSLQYHTIQQAIDDLVYFAKNVNLPMPGGDQVGPDKAPWILIGGSYPGALVSYAMYNKPDAFFAAYSSSGVVQSIGHFWQYYEPIRQHMAPNCSADLSAAVDYIDKVLDSGDKDKIQEVKAIFGLEGIVHNDDFGEALKRILNTWQDSDVDVFSPDFQAFCDWLETDDDGNIAPATGWGLKYGLGSWGSYWTVAGYYNATCGTYDAEACFGTHHNASYYNRIEAPNDDRAWKWMTCNEFGFHQVGGAPKDHPAIVSRHHTAEYWERSCQYDFPDVLKDHKQYSLLNALDVNTKYGGWNVTTERIVFVNGERDPWRESTVAADGAKFPKNDRQPHIVTDGFHCSDMLTANAAYSPRIKAAQKESVQHMKTWWGEWTTSHKS